MCFLSLVLEGLIARTKDRIQEEFFSHRFEHIGLDRRLALLVPGSIIPLFNEKKKQHTFPQCLSWQWISWISTLSSPHSGALKATVWTMVFLTSTAVGPSGPTLSRAPWSAEAASRTGSARAPTRRECLYTARAGMYYRCDGWPPLHLSLLFTVPSFYEADYKSNGPILVEENSLRCVLFMFKRSFLVFENIFWAKHIGQFSSDKPCSL